MNAPASHHPAPNPLEQEWQRLTSTVYKILDCLFNRALKLTLTGARRRKLILGSLFLGIISILILRTHPWVEWQDQLRNVFVYLLSKNSPQLLSTDPLGSFVSFIWGAITAPSFLRILPVLLLPYYIAQQLAANYLADIFELDEVRTARRFILQAAIGIGYHRINIGQGDAADKDKRSQINQIGGPGYVMVELDSAALFEKPDGRPRVIGPTVNEPKKVAVLEGFERLRQVIDLRDHYTDPIKISDRSLDGIPVDAQDVRLVFSVWRGDNEQSKKPSLKRPHPFIENSIPALVYGQRCSVSSESGTLTKCAPWTNTMGSIIRNNLRDFINKHKLAEFLTSIGEPEVAELYNLEQLLNMSGQPNPIPSPTFHPRTEVTSLFHKFAEDFTHQEIMRGVKLHWIGVGTWHTPDVIIPERHLEAWRISRENVARKSPKVLQELREEAELQEILHLVQEVPLNVFRYCKVNKMSEDKTLRAILLGYRGQLHDARDKIKNGSDSIIPPAIDSAIGHIESISAHWVQASTPPPNNAEG